jgi:hypothetical protein
MMTSARRPTPAEVDDLCLAFDKARIAVETAEQQYSNAKGPLLAAIQNFGYVPAHAEKTTRLEGIVYIADATVASAIAVNEAPVGELQSELSRLKLPKIFTTLFDRKVKHSLRKDADSALKLAVGGFASDVQARLLGLFASCFTVTAKAPALSVDLAAALRRKEAEAQAKAEAKAAKAAKKKQ